MPSVIYVAIGLPGFIRCPVEANPPVTLVKWKKDGLPLRIDKVSWYCSFGHFTPPQTAQAVIPLPYMLLMLYSTTVPWLEPNGRWEHPRGRGDRGLSWHLYLHALQCPGIHGMVPSRSPGAKGKHIVSVDVKHSGGNAASPILELSLRVGPSQILSGSWRGVQAGGWERTSHPL